VACIIHYQDSRSQAHTFVDLFLAAIFHVLCPNTTRSLKTKEVLNLLIVHSFKVNDSILGDMSV